MEDNIKKTTNQSLAAFLVAKGHEVLDVEFKDSYRPQLGSFLFEKSDELEKDMHNFKVNKAVKIQDYISAQNQCKHWIIDKQEEMGVYKYGKKPRI